MGRKKLTTETLQNPEWAQSIKHAAGMLGCDPSVLRQLKVSGSKAFRNSRVHLPTLRKELEESGKTLADAQAETKEELEKRRILAQCIKLEMENEVRRGELVSRETIRYAIPKYIGAIVAELEKHLTPGAYNAIRERLQEAGNRLTHERTA